MSPQPIPKYIERLALKLAAEEAEHARAANTLEGAQAIVDRLDAESEAGGFASVKEYIESLTTDRDGVSPPEGTRPTSAFWSHGTHHAQAPQNWAGENFLDNRYVAEAWATVQNKRSADSARTLETTEGGRRLNEMHLFEDAVRQALGGDEQGFTYAWARDCWGSISQTYAEASEGPVVVVSQTAHTRSILYNRELPTLHANQDVGLDNIHFAYAPPREWPQEARNEIGADTVRAQVQVDDPTLPHYVDPVAYAAQDPVQRKAAVDAECASVAVERAERTEEKRETATTAEEETATTAEVEATAPRAEASAMESPAPAEKPTAAMPVWQMGFKPAPVKIAPASAAPAAQSTPPPQPAVGKQAADTGLG
ncbi:hypothetical protein QA943_23325 [Streptomyces sp. B21-097]|uniref:hypothetical protein n=1 Tax=Streptomyces sp. B21-097 TaxID=3039414 RepID=UPI002FF0E601